MSRSSTGKRDKILQLRNENPLMNSVEIGKTVGVSKQYVHKILKKEGLVTYVPKRKTIYKCKLCDNVLPKGKRTVCSPECHFKYYRIPVTCSFCHVGFYLKRSEVAQRYKRRYNRIHCSRTCYNKDRRDR